MPIHHVNGNALDTQAQTLCLGLNLRGRASLMSYETILRTRFPVFFSDYQRSITKNTLQGGNLWLFRDATPWLLGMILQDNPNGAVRLRYLEQALLQLRRDWQVEGITSLAILPFADPLEWATHRQMIDESLGGLPISIFLYDSFSAHDAPTEPPLA